MVTTMTAERSPAGVLGNHDHDHAQDRQREAREGVVRGRGHENDRESVTAAAAVIKGGKKQRVYRVV